MPREFCHFVYAWLVLFKSFIQTDVASYCIWELCFLSFNNSWNTEPFICFLFFCSLGKCQEGGGRLIEGVHRFTWAALIWKSCVMFHSFWLGKWNLYSHGGTFRFDCSSPCAVQEGLFLSALWFTFSHLSLSPTSISMTSQSELEQRCSSLSLPFFWNFYWEFLEIWPYYVIWPLSSVQNLTVPMNFEVLGEETIFLSSVAAR